jgi:hypothetical protein
MGYDSLQEIFAQSVVLQSRKTCDRALASSEEYKNVVRGLHLAGNTGQTFGETQYKMWIR